MKKYIALTVLTFGIIGSINAMEHEPPIPQEKQSGFGILDLVTDVGSFFSQVSDDIHQAFSAEQEQTPIERAKNLVRQELSNKRLSQAISDSTIQDNPKQFFALLIGMKALDIHASSQSKTAITDYLNALLKQHKEETTRIMQERITQMKELQALRAQFSDTTASDDNETELSTLTSKLLSD